jgi:hypothetical protein
MCARAIRFPSRWSDGDDGARWLLLGGPSLRFDEETMPTSDFSGRGVESSTRPRVSHQLRQRGMLPRIREASAHCHCAVNRISLDVVAGIAAGARYRPAHLSTPARSQPKCCSTMLRTIAISVG